VKPVRRHQVDALNLTVPASPLGAWHRRFFDEQLSGAVQAPAFAAFDRSAFDDGELGWGLSAWRGRTLDEYRSQVAFTTLLSELTQDGAPWGVLSAAVRLVRDESRHVELCRRLVGALGGDDLIPGTPAFVGSDVTAPLHVRLFDTIAGSLCLGETLSAALLSATLKVTKEPLSRGVLEVLTRDEVFHSSLGWALLPEAWARLSTRERPRRRRLLSDMLGWTKAAVFAHCTDDADEPRSPFGHLKTHERSAVYQRAVERQVVPKFAAAGVALKLR
jgi:hypothetical protein